MEKNNHVTISQSEDGLWGVTRDGKTLIPFIYDEITAMEDVFCCRIWEDCEMRDENGHRYQGCESPRLWLIDDPEWEARPDYCNDKPKDLSYLRIGLDRVPPKEVDGMYIIYKDGHFGLQDNSHQEVLPAIYDNVTVWYDCDVVYVRDGINHLYFDRQGKRILTVVPNQSEWVGDLPFYLGEEQDDIALFTMEAHPKIHDEQCCTCYGMEVRLDRPLKKDIEQMLRADCQLKPFARDAFHWFNNEANYIYRAYVAHGKSIKECIEQLKAMRCYNSSWYYIDKISVHPSQTHRPKGVYDLHVAAARGKYVPHTSSTRWYSGIGYDDSLEEDEIRVFHIEYYWEVPPSWW